MATVPGFEFPPLGPTGEGEADGEQGRLVWQGPGEYMVTEQRDVPAVRRRCHYPGGSCPCDEATAQRFVEYINGGGR